MPANLVNSMTPEEKARQAIDAMLVASGWVVQDYKAFNPAAGRGIALREVPLKSGRCDYLLLVDRKAVGVAEAKKTGTTLSTVADQSGHYCFRVASSAVCSWLPHPQYPQRKAPIILERLDRCRDFQHGIAHGRQSVAF